MQKKNKINNENSTFTLVFKIICFLFLTIYVITLLYAFFWAIMNSFKGNMAYLNDPIGFPEKFEFKNYVESIKYFTVKVKSGNGNRNVPILEMLLYSILYGGGSAFFQTVACCVMAYAVAMYDNKISRIIYIIVIFTMIMPIVGSLPSEIQMLNNLHLYDTFLGTWVLSFNFLGMYFLIFHSAFKSLPKDYAEAAKIDGAGDYRIFLQILLPLVKYVFATIFLLKFIVYWNDYQTPLVYIPNKPTIAYGLYKFNMSSVGIVSNTPHKLAGCMIVFLPILLLFLCFHKRIIGNVSMGGIKG